MTGSLAVAAAIVVGCGASPPEQDRAGPRAAPGYAVEIDVVAGLERPTQMVVGPDGRLWAAQLAGAEGAGEGEIVAVDPDAGTLDVLADGLDKPTGLALLDGAVWIQQRRSLLRAPLRETASGVSVGAPEVLLDGLPFNGRSEGTLTVTPQGTLLYETSGARSGADVVADSGRLWELDPHAPDSPRVVATGLKNAYAHTVLDDGSIVVTDVLEPLPGVEPDDEVNRLTAPGGDFGWPRCTGDNEPVTQLGATGQDCAGAMAPVARLGPGATPTAVVVAPWDSQSLLVARWNVGDVVRVPLSGGPPRTVLDLPGRPQHLLVQDDAVLVSDHQQGVVHRLRRAD